MKKNIAQEKTSGRCPELHKQGSSSIPKTKYKATSRALQQHLFSLLQNSISPPKLHQIHTQILINGYSRKSFLIAKLFSLYFSSGFLLNPHHISHPRSTTLWNQIIRATQQLPLTIQFFNQMGANGTNPDGYTFSFVLGACVKARALRPGIQLHGRLLSSGFSSNVVVQTNLVNLYAMVGGGDVGVRDARRVFDAMSDRSVVTWNSMLAGVIRCGNVDEGRRVFNAIPQRNVVSWTTMIGGCAQNGRCKQALSLFDEMRRAQVEFDQVTLVAVLSACAELGDLKLGRWIHSYIYRKLNVANELVLVTLNNSLMHMYASCGFIEEAFAVFEGMPTRSTVSWTVMITGFAKQGRGREAIDIFRRMQCSAEDDVRPDGITMIGLLCACSHGGLVAEGRHLFNSIRTWGIQPRIEHYGCMVDILSRAGHLDEALEIVEAMPMKPNEAVWGALLGGCRIHKNVQLASQVAQKLVVELEPDQAAGYLVLLSNVYATARRWQDFVNVRRAMIEMGIKKKLAGRSWIQITGIIHEFMAGETTHKDADLTNRMLFDVTREAQWGGYDPDIVIS